MVRDPGNIDFNDKKQLDFDLPDNQSHSEGKDELLAEIDRNRIEALDLSSVIPTDSISDKIKALFREKDLVATSENSVSRKILYRGAKLVRNIGLAATLLHGAGVVDSYQEVEDAPDAVALAITHSELRSFDNQFYGMDGSEASEYLLSEEGQNRLNTVINGLENDFSKIEQETIESAEDIQSNTTAAVYYLALGLAGALVASRAGKGFDKKYINCFSRTFYSRGEGTLFEKTEPKSHITRADNEDVSDVYSVKELDRFLDNDVISRSMLWSARKIGIFAGVMATLPLLHIAQDVTEKIDDEISVEAPQRIEDEAIEISQGVADQKIQETAQVASDRIQQNLPNFMQALDLTPEQVEQFVLDGVQISADPEQIISDEIEGDLQPFEYMFYSIEQIQEYFPDARDDDFALYTYALCTMIGIMAYAFPKGLRYNPDEQTRVLISEAVLEENVRRWKSEIAETHSDKWDKQNDQLAEALDSIGLDYKV